MIAPRKLAVAVAGLFLATMLWWYWRGGKVANSAGDQPPTRNWDGPATASSNDSASGTKTTVAEQALQSPAPHAPVGTTSNSAGSDEFVAATLKNPGHSMLPSKIPALSDAQVDQLAAAYLKIARPTQKSGILWALGFSQNDRAFDTLHYAMSGEYPGAVLSQFDNVAQLQVAPLIGVLSRTSDRAWQFLVLCQW